MSNMNDWASTGTDSIMNSPVGGAIDTLDTIASYVPAMLLIFPEPLVPIPLPIPLPILFNPEKLKFDKSMTWKSTNGSKRNAPEADFGGGEPERFTLKLFLDTSFVPMGIQAYVFLL